LYIQGRLNCPRSACADGVAASWLSLKLSGEHHPQGFPRCSAFCKAGQEEMVTTGTFLGSGTKE